MPEAHPYFSEEAFKFLRGLARHNDRTWFDARKPIYESELKAPMLALVEEINADLTSFAPEFVRPAQKCVMRIYRDIRFSKNKDPYKTNLAAWWSRQGLEKTSGGGFYLQISPESVLVAAGVYMPERDQLLAIRNHLAEHHAAFRKILAAKKLKGLLTPFDGLALSRGPKGYPPDHPAIDLLSQQQWGVSATLPAEQALAPTLAGEVVKHFQAAIPLVNFLNDSITGSNAKPAFLP